MVRYGELDTAVSAYIRGDIHEIIPTEYFRRSMKTAIQMQNDGKHWDIQQSAAVLLYYAFNDEHLHPSQLTSEGLDALTFAEKLLHKHDIDNPQEAGLHEEVIDVSMDFVVGISNR